MHHIFFIHSSVNERVGYFHVLVNSATLGCICLLKPWFFPNTCPGMGLTDHMVILFFFFWGSSKLSATEAAPPHVATNIMTNVHHDPNRHAFQVSHVPSLGLSSFLCPLIPSAPTLTGRYHFPNLELQKLRLRDSKLCGPGLLWSQATGTNWLNKQKRADGKLAAPCIEREPGDKTGIGQLPAQEPLTEVPSVSIAISGRHGFIQTFLGLRS